MDWLGIGDGQPVIWTTHSEHIVRRRLLFPEGCSQALYSSAVVLLLLLLLLLLPISTPYFERLVTPDLQTTPRRRPARKTNPGSDRAGGFANQTAAYIWDSWTFCGFIESSNPGLAGISSHLIHAGLGAWRCHTAFAALLYSVYSVYSVYYAYYASSVLSVMLSTIAESQREALRAEQRATPTASS